MGLSVNESKVYEALLTLGITTANKIALEAKIQRRNVYDTVKKLKEMGLCSEVIEDGITGLLVRPKDPDALAKAVCSLLNNPQKAKQIADKAKEVSEKRFNTISHAKAVLSAYKNLLNQNEEV